MYVRNQVLLVVITVVGVSFLANAQQPAGDPTPVVAPVPRAATTDDAVVPPTDDAPLTESPAAVEPVPAPAANSAAASAPTATATAEVAPAERVPRAFHGSSLSYSHSISALTLAPAAEGHYNPTWGHRLGLFPEWHFNDQLFVRGRLYLAQEFTTSDTTKYANEVELSDIWLDVGASGYTEPRTGLHVGADVRFLIPTSKASQFQSRILTVGPSLSLSREFAVLSGLSVAYSGRFTYRFNRFSTSQNQGGLITNGGGAPCTDFRNAESPECNTDSGKLNVNYDFVHGPDINFKVTEKLSFEALFLYYHLFLYAPSPVPAQYAGSQGLSADAATVKNASLFALSVSFQVTKPISLTFGTWTVSGQPSTDGRYRFPLFNRDTSLYLDATFDIEAAAASLF